jgi:hypothetical protein
MATITLVKSPDKISLDKALLEMAKTDRAGKPLPFAITFITCDLNRKTGGERISHRATLNKPGGANKKYHERNDVRNIRIVNSEAIRAVHPLLITHFNGKEVYI